MSEKFEGGAPTQERKEGEQKKWTGLGTLCKDGRAYIGGENFKLSDTPHCEHLDNLPDSDQPVYFAAKGSQVVLEGGRHATADEALCLHCADEFDLRRESRWDGPSSWQQHEGGNLHINLKERTFVAARDTKRFKTAGSLDNVKDLRDAYSLLSQKGLTPADFVFYQLREALGKEPCSKCSPGQKFPYGFYAEGECWYCGNHESEKSLESPAGK